jgi:hypothetical protein
MEFPWKAPRKRHVDFGPSAHGRNFYTEEERADPTLGPKIRTWERFLGRRVDLMTRTVGPHRHGIDAAVRDWLAEAAPLPWRGAKKMPSPWWLARRPVIEFWPMRGVTVWSPAADLPRGVDPLPEAG